MNPLTPVQAATIANGVYLLIDQDPSVLAARGGRLGCEDSFAVTNDSYLKGRSGALLWKPLSGFGYIAWGVNGREGEVLCVTRGTDLTCDWLSNLNVGVQSGPGGELVHAGFNDVWKSFAKTLDTFVKGRKPTHIHCVGHSLGGALAALSADHFSSRGMAPVSLYTFGAPRSGLSPYLRNLTKKLTPERIFRVSHIADPVPMIPLFPFGHVAFSAPGYLLGAEWKGAPLSVGAHAMKGSYIPGVGTASWSALPTELPTVTDSALENWLATAGDGGTVKMMSGHALQMITRALKWLLKRSAMIVGASVGTTMMVNATLLDQMSLLLSRGVELSKALAGHGIALVKAILAFLGRAGSTAVEMSTAFLRWVLEMLFVTVKSIAWRAASRL